MGHTRTPASLPRRRRCGLCVSVDVRPPSHSRAVNVHTLDRRFRELSEDVHARKPGLPAAALQAPRLVVATRKAQCSAQGYVHVVFSSLPLPALPEQRRHGAEGDRRTTSSKQQASCLLQATQATCVFAPTPQTYLPTIPDSVSSLPVIRTSPNLPLTLLASGHRDSASYCRSVAPHRAVVRRGHISLDLTFCSARCPVSSHTRHATHAPC